MHGHGRSDKQTTEFCFHQLISFQLIRSTKSAGKARSHCLDQTLNLKLFVAEIQSLSRIGCSTLYDLEQFSKADNLRN